MKELKKVDISDAFRKHNYKKSEWWLEEEYYKIENEKTVQRRLMP